MKDFHILSWLAAVPVVVACSQSADSTDDAAPGSSTLETGSGTAATTPGGGATTPNGSGESNGSAGGSGTTGQAGSGTGSDTTGAGSTPLASTPGATSVPPDSTATSTSTSTDTDPPVTDPEGGAGGTPPVDDGVEPEVIDPPEPVACQGALPTPDVSAATHTVSVQTGSSMGALPHFWTTYGLGRIGLYLPESALRAEHAAQDRTNFHGEKWSDVLTAQTLEAIDSLELRRIRAHGMFHDDIGMYSEDASGNPVFDFTRSDVIFDLLVENGVAPIIELASMPAALAADPSRTVFDWKMVVSPPKDYAKWQALVQAFVQHSVDRYGEEVANSWYYEVWNEPECCSGKFWGGSGTPASAQEYFQLYDAAAAGVRAVLPSGRMGGPVTSQPTELVGGQWEGGAGVLFLDHITQNSGVLDFFTFHTWSFLDGAINGYFQGLDLLDSYGLNQIQVAVTEFGPTWEFGLRGVGMEPDWEPQETSQGAAFAAQVYADISRRSAQEGRRFPIAYAWWTLSDVFDEGYEDPADYVLEENPFIGAMGLINREGIKKPTYNTYKFLARMGTEQITLSTQGPGGVNGFASRDGQGGVQVLLYNGQNPGGGFRDDTYYAIADAQPIGITIDGLDPELSYDVNVYRVDETHGNSFAIWNGMGRPTMSAMSDADWQALRDGAESPAEPIARALCGSSVNVQVDLASPGVAFIELTPAVE